MINHADSLKVIVGTVTAAWAAPAAISASQSAETLIVGVPTSVLLCAIVGVLIGVLLLEERDTVRVIADKDVVGRWPRVVQVAQRVGLLAALLLAYAIAAAWVSEFAAYLLPGLAGGPQMSMAGISGAIIRRMLPRYLAVVERVTGNGDDDD